MVQGPVEHAAGDGDGDEAGVALQRARDQLEFRVRSWNLDLDRKLLALLDRLGAASGMLAADETLRATFAEVARHTVRACRLAAFDRTLPMRERTLPPGPSHAGFTRADPPAQAALRGLAAALVELEQELRLTAEHQEYVDALNNARIFLVAAEELGLARRALAGAGRGSGC